MATNLKQGNPIRIQYTIAATVTVGTVVLLGDQGLWGFAEQGGVSGDTITVAVPGACVIEHDVLGNNGSAGAAIAIFDKVYGDGAVSAFFDVNTSDTFMGFVLNAVGSGATVSSEVLMQGPIA